MVNPHLSRIFLAVRYLKARSSIGTSSSFRHSTAVPHAFKQREQLPRFHSTFPPSRFMITSPMSRRPISPFTNYTFHPSSDTMMKSVTPSLKFEESELLPHQADSDQMIFGLELDELSRYEQAAPPLSPWDVHPDHQSPRSFSNITNSPSSFTHLGALPHFDTQLSQLNHLAAYSVHPDVAATSPDHDESNFYLSYWVNDHDPNTTIPTASSPIPIPSSMSDFTDSSAFTPHNDVAHYPDEGPFSPSQIAAFVPLPRSFSPSATIEELHPSQSFESVSPRETSLRPPEWATTLWDDQSFQIPTSPPGPAHRFARADGAHPHRRHRYPTRRDSPYLGQSLHSSSAPSLIESDLPSQTRSYRRRAESMGEDNDATIRRKKRVSPSEEPDKASETRMQSFTIVTAFTTLIPVQPLPGPCCALLSWRHLPGSFILRTGSLGSKRPALTGS
jgi:hypothetical protein